MGLDFSKNFFLAWMYIRLYENKTKAITLMGATDKTVVEASLSCAMLLNLFLTPVLMGKVMIEVPYKVKGI